MAARNVRPGIHFDRRPLLACVMIFGSVLGVSPCEAAAVGSEASAGRSDLSVVSESAPAIQPTNLLAQRNRVQDPDQELVEGAVGFGVLVCYVAFICGIMGFVAYLQYRLAAAIPEPYQVMKPGLVWLNMVPPVNIVWQFLVMMQIPQGYRRWLASMNTTWKTEDCHEMLGLLTCVFGMIPCLNIASPIMLIVWFVKMFELKRYAEEQSRAGAVASSGPFAAGPFAKPSANPYQSPGSF